MVEYFKTFVVAIALQILSYLHPLGDEIFILAMIFVLNFFCGFLVDLIVNNGGFKFKKAWRCVTELTLFFALVVFVYTYGEKKGHSEGAIQCVSFITYVITYFYGLNSLRNLKLLFKENTSGYRVMSFLYYFLSIEFVKKIPHLADFLNVSTDDRIDKEHIIEGDQQA